MLNKKNSVHENEIRTIVFDFYFLMQQSNVEEVYAMLSPNLRQLVIMDQHKDKYESAFKFGKKIYWANLFSLSEVKPGVNEGIVAVCVLPTNIEEAAKSPQKREENMRYSSHKMKFIFLENYWFIDEITLYNEFWGNEFKNSLIEQ